MATESLELVEVLKVPPERLYRAWLDSKEHSAMTGAPTTIQPVVGAAFQADEGYIRGINVVLEPNKRIVQQWRTTEFPPGAPPSMVELLFEEDPAGTRLVLRHTDIPEGQADRYREGWKQYYLSPMSDYFGSEERNPPTDVQRVPSGGEVGIPPAQGTSPANQEQLPIEQARGDTDVGPVVGREDSPRRKAAARAKGPSRGTTGSRVPAARKAPARKAAPAKKAATGAKKGKPEGRKAPRTSTARAASARGQKLTARAERGVKKGAARTGGVRKAAAPKGKAKAVASRRPTKAKGKGRR